MAAMRVLMTAVGSRGDVLPRLALAVELRTRGHDVTLGCVEQFRGLVEARGIPWARLGAFPEADTEAFVLRQVMRDPDPARRGEQLLAALLAPMLPGILGDLAALAAAVDLTVVNDLLAPAALPNPWFRPARLAVTITTQPVGGYARILRGTPWPKVVGSSRCLLPTNHGLGPDFRLTDFWLFDADPAFHPDPLLETFLGEGPPPIAIVLGSAVGRDPHFPPGAFEEAVGRRGCRAVIQRSVSDRHGDRPVRIGSSILTVGEVPYGWLFPRVGCVVHHGGAGTVAETLRAGRPSVAIPQYGDHLYWSLRLEALGASAGTLRPGEVTPGALAALIGRALGETELQATAAGLGKTIDPIRGIARACDELELAGSTAGRRGDPPVRSGA